MSRRDASRVAGTSLPFAPALLMLASSAAAQPFGFVHRMVPPDVEGTEALALADVDGDGDLDAILASWDRVSLYLNDGNAVFTDVTATSVPAPIWNASAIAVGDVNADGDLDALVGTFYGQQNRLLRNGGTGVFTDATATNLPSVLDNTLAIGLGDVDGDGDLDAFVGNGLLYGSGGQERLHLNDGTGVFAEVTATNLPVSNDDTRAVALGDLDGDGDLDAFVGNSGGPSPNGQKRLYLNAGLGTFTDVTATNIPALLENTQAIALGDEDGDGDLDAFIANGGFWGPGQQNRLYSNGGAAVFTDVTGTNLPALLDNTRALALADVDGDSDLDAFLGNAGQNGLLLNGGGGVFTDATATLVPAFVSGTAAIGIGDLDGDGDLDGLMGNWYSQKRLYLNDGTGAFSDVTAASPPPLLDVTSAVALGDVDGDDDLDAFIGNSGFGGGVQDRLLLNDGAGGLADATGTNLPAASDTTEAVALGDVDGDGDLDAFIGNLGTFPPGEQNRLYLNGGTGVFADVTATNLPPLIDYTSAVALGDVDGDGDLDASVGNYLQPNRLLRNDGTGAFTDVTTTNLPALVLATLSLALGDVDGDGDLDAFVGTYLQPDRLLLNDGTGVFTSAPAGNLPAVVDRTLAVALGDVDEDGDLDALLGNGEFSYPEPNRLYLNGGSGIFTDVSAASLPPFLGATAAVALGDADEDGDLDAFAGPNRLLLNAGTGVFTDAPPTVFPVPDLGWSALALGDLDGDGDLDAYAGAGEDFLCVNLARQLSWRGIPRIGKPLVLDVRGPPLGAWFLGFSFGTASVPIPPLGTLRLDPSSLFFAFAGILDAEGRAAVPLQVPGNPSLFGASVYWQALVAGPARFTNLEVTTLTNL